MRMRTLIAPFLAMLLAVGLAGCQTLREVSSLKEVQFRIDRATDVRLSGVSLSTTRSYDDLRAGQVAQLMSSLAQGTLPFSFTLLVDAENPASNSVQARLTGMDWTLLLADTETISGTIDREVRLPPGEPRTIPVDLELDLVTFFDDNLKQLVGLATAVVGEGPPTNVTLRVQPQIQTPLGRMKYPRPIEVVSRDVGATAP
jgi:hypothetical protein